MTKSLSLMFAIINVLLMLAIAISINYSVWLVLLFTLILIGFLGFSFATKARLDRKKAKAE
ncbi:hypothetical protein BVG16_04400 [Paenibacillus selenitireducens]|jgi:hypothetical protein|uniref:Uncharacterized protein n=1 Tax=Paenibacillus selenitireducens TaxID=1324314 RepID=A0A1T2XJE7_9BACL|nr:hypothetical protein [Paenibacillus selenitireducens]OPA80000.1 hypothetical protein BVG16_04400 [Paenibacillus selenitireducens]